jgi:hypothetical protein
MTESKTGRFNIMIQTGALILSICMLAVFSVGAMGGEALTVSECTADGNGKKEDLAKEFANRIGSRDGWSAKVIANQNWTKVAAGANTGNHVNLMGVKFGNRVDFLALLLGNNGLVEHAVRVPALEQQGSTYWYTLSPGRSQLIRNAPTDLVAEFANSMQERSVEKPILAIDIQPWPENDIEDASPGTKNPGKTDSIKLMQLVCAAAYQAGYRPALNESAKGPLLTFHFRQHADSFDIRSDYATGAGSGGKKASATLYGIGFEDIYEALVVSSCNMLKWNGKLAGFAKLGSDNFIPLAFFSLASDNGSMKPLIVGIESDQGKPKLTALAPGRNNPVWALILSKNSEKNIIVHGDGIYLKTEKGFTKVNLKTGRQENVTEEAANALERKTAENEFNISGLYLKIEKNGTLSARKNETDKPQWEQSIGDVLLVPPVLLDSKILLISKTNRIMSLNPANGAITAENSWPTWLTAAAMISGPDPKFACMDIRNRFSLLGPDLKTVTSLQFPFPMHPLIFNANNFPERWNFEEGELVESGPSCLMFDRDGHIYIFMLNALKGKL